MQLNPYGEGAVRLAVDLANHPPACADELGARCAAAGMMVNQPATESDLRRTKESIAHWWRVVDAPTPEARAAELNRMLRDASTHPRLRQHDDQGWHLHYRDDDVPLADVVRCLITVGTALHLATRGMTRLGRCAAHDCARAYADTTRNGLQRYCSPRCTNRDAVRRHRIRHA